MLPSCCGSEMKVKFETNRFYEAVCQTCNDSVYVKKETDLRPVLLDD